MVGVDGDVMPLFPSVLFLQRLLGRGDTISPMDRALGELDSGITEGGSWDKLLSPGGDEEIVGELLGLFPWMLLSHHRQLSRGPRDSFCKAEKQPD